LSEEKAPREGDQWLGSLNREEDAAKEPRRICLFDQVGVGGHENLCWLVPSPETCRLCLMGRISEYLGLIIGEMRDRQ